MFTNADAIFRLSKASKYASEIFEQVEDDVKGITIHTYSNGDHQFECEESKITSVIEGDYDSYEDEVFRNNIVECYSLDASKNLDTCYIVKLKGIRYRVIKFKSMVLLNNEIDNVVEYKCDLENLKMLLESVDKNYEVYNKTYNIL